MSNILEKIVKSALIETEDFNSDFIFRILVVRQDAGLGKLVLLTPLISGLKATFPDADVDVLVSGKCQEIYANNPDVDNTIVLQKKACFIPWSYPRFIYCLRGKGYDLAVDASNGYHYSFHNMFLTFLSGAWYRLGFNRDDAKLFFNLLVPLPPEDTYLADAMFNLIKYISPDVKEFPLSYHTSNSEKSFADEWLKEKHITEFDSFFVIHPGGVERKQWGVRNFAALIERLRSGLGVRIVVIGSEAEDELVAGIKDISEKDFDILQHITIGQMASVIERCDMFIGNDSGPLQVSTALDRPTVGIFISSDFRVSGPRGKNGRIVLGTERSPAIDDVLVAVMDLLGGHSETGIDNQ